MCFAGLDIRKAAGRSAAMIAIALLTSCMNRPNGYSSRFESVSSSGWYQEDTLCFDIDTIADNGLYDIFVEIRNDYTFPYKYLWLSVKTETRQPYTCRYDTLRCPITDDSGDFQGTGLTLFGHRHHLFQLPLHQGQYGNITICHIMRQNPIQGVSDIGVTVVPLS